MQVLKEVNSNFPGRLCICLSFVWKCFIPADSFKLCSVSSNLEKCFPFWKKKHFLEFVRIGTGVFFLNVCQWACAFKSARVPHHTQKWYSQICRFASARKQEIGPSDYKISQFEFHGCCCKNLTFLHRETPSDNWSSQIFSSRVVFPSL